MKYTKQPLHETSLFIEGICHRYKVQKPFKTRHTTGTFPWKKIR